VTTKLFSTLQKNALVGLTQFLDTKPLTVAKKQHEVSATKDTVYYTSQKKKL
jgi:hypothetical protein